MISKTSNAIGERAYRETGPLFVCARRRDGRSGVLVIPPGTLTILQLPPATQEREMRSFSAVQKEVLFEMPDLLLFQIHRIELAFWSAGGSASLPTSPTKKRGSHLSCYPVSGCPVNLANKRSTPFWAVILPSAQINMAHPSGRVLQGLIALLTCANSNRV